MGLNWVFVLKPVRKWSSPLQAVWETQPGRDSIRAATQNVLWAFKGNRSQSGDCVQICWLLLWRGKAFYFVFTLKGGLLSSMMWCVQWFRIHLKCIAQWFFVALAVFCFIAISVNFFCVCVFSCPWYIWEHRYQVDWHCLKWAIFKFTRNAITL